MPPKPITILHLSDTQFGPKNIFRCNKDNVVKDDRGNTRSSAEQERLDLESAELLFTQLSDDFREFNVERNYQLKPDIVIITGDLTEDGTEGQFKAALRLIQNLAKEYNLDADHIVVVPGNHDVDETFYKDLNEDERNCEQSTDFPFWGRWENYYEYLFKPFYGDRVTFSKEKPWSIFKTDNRKVVIFGVNSTIKHYSKGTRGGHTGDKQQAEIRTLAGDYKDKGYLRIVAMHHNLRADGASSRVIDDSVDFIRAIGKNVNLILHGHLHKGSEEYSPNGTRILSAGSVSINSDERAPDVLNQYQVLRIYPKKIQRYSRAYYPAHKRFIGDTSMQAMGLDWSTTLQNGDTFNHIEAAFPTHSLDNETFDDVKSFSNAGDITTTLTIIKGGQSLEVCMPHNVFRYYLIKQKWGDLEKSDIDAIKELVELGFGSKDNDGKFHLKLKIIYLKVLSQKEKFEDVIKLGQELLESESLKRFSDQVPGVRHRLGIAYSILGNPDMAKKHFDNAEGNEHSRITTECFRAIANYFCNDERHAEPFEIMRNSQLEYLAVDPDPSFWQTNGLKSAIQCLFAEAAICMGDKDTGSLEDSQGNVRLIIAHFLANQISISSLAEGYSELLSMIWCKKHFKHAIENRKKLRMRIEKAMHTDPIRRTLFQKEHAAKHFDLYEKFGEAYKIVPLSHPTKGKWEVLRKKISDHCY